MINLGGDNLELQAISDSLNLRIVLYVRDNQLNQITINPHEDEKTNPTYTIYILLNKKFDHYLSLKPIDNGQDSDATTIRDSVSSTEVNAVRKKVKNLRKTRQGLPDLRHLNRREREVYRSYLQDSNNSPDRSRTVDDRQMISLTSYFKKQDEKKEPMEDIEIVYKELGDVEEKGSDDGKMKRSKSLNEQTLQFEPKVNKRMKAQSLEGDAKRENLREIPEIFTSKELNQKEGVLRKETFYQTNVQSINPTTENSSPMFNEANTKGKLELAFEECFTKLISEVQHNDDKMFINELRKNNNDNKNNADLTILTLTICTLIKEKMEAKKYKDKKEDAAQLEKLKERIVELEEKNKVLEDKVNELNEKKIIHIEKNINTRITDIDLEKNNNVLLEKVSKTTEKRIEQLEANFNRKTDDLTELHKQLQEWYKDLHNKIIMIDIDVSTLKAKLEEGYNIQNLSTQKIESELVTILESIEKYQGNLELRMKQITEEINSRLINDKLETKMDIESEALQKSYTEDRRVSETHRGNKGTLLQAGENTAVHQNGN